MKMTTTIRFNLLCVLIFLIFPMQDIASAAQPLPAKAFSMLPEIDHVRISPDGKRLLFLLNENDKTMLVSKDLDTGKLVPIIKTSNTNFKLRLIEWANNDTILFSAALPFNRSGVDIVETRMFTAKADVSGSYKLLVRPNVRPIGKIERMSQSQDDVLSLLPDDPEHILMGLDFDSPGRPSVCKININTGSRKVVQRHRKILGGWMTDQQDRIRIGQTFQMHNRQISTFIYSLDNKKWREVWKAKVFSESEVTPLGFGKDPNILYVRADHNGRDAIFKVDVSKVDLPMELVAKDDHDDINGRLIYSPKTRDAVGVYHGADDKDRIYWNKTFQGYQASIDKDLPDTSNYLIDFSRDERLYIVYATSDTKPGTYYIGDRDRRTLDILEHTYPQLKGKLRGNKKVEYTARDGKTIEGYLTLPANYNPEAPGPAMIFPYSGSTARDYGDFDYWAEFFASRGSVVFQPNFRDSSDYGWEFPQELIKTFGLGMQDDLTDAANWLIEKKLADPKRIAIAGGSYNGYAALMGAVKTPDLFRCAISFAGVSDLETFLDSLRSFTIYHIAREQLGKDSEKLKAVSTYRHVDKIKIPILLVHGEDDRIVPVKQSREMAKKLEKKGKVYTYIELEGGDHYLSNQENRHKFFSAMDEFLNKYLL